MASDCMCCRKKEEQLYWSHFQTVQFCQFLSGRFDHQLAIPEKFTRGLREKMSGTVALIGPSGHEWEVGLVIDEGALLLKHGWKSFVQDHSLEENDILIFKYRGDSKFHVSMFDRESQCEKVASYFVKKCEHEDSRYGNKQMINVEEDKEEEDEEGEGEGFEDNNIEYSDDENVLNWVKRQRVRKTIGTPPPEIQPTRLTLGGGGKRTQRGKQGSSSGYKLQLKSCRREVTKEEINKVQQMAAEAAASCDNGFAVVMRASHVSKGFFMSIPVDWTKDHLPKKDQDIQLRVNDNIWLVKYQYRGNGGGLCNGWKKFVLDNSLEELDVCVFDLASGPRHSCTLDVRIFRVVERVIPLAKVK